MSLESSKEIPRDLFTDFWLQTFAQHAVLVHQAHHQSDGGDSGRVQRCNVSSSSGTVFDSPSLLLLVVVPFAARRFDWPRLFRRSFAAIRPAFLRRRSVRTSRSRLRAAAGRGQRVRLSGKPLPHVRGVSEIQSLSLCTGPLCHRSDQRRSVTL